MQAIGSEPRLMPHLHLSLQHGDDLILKRMKRRHLRDDAIRFCSEARALRPDITWRITVWQRVMGLGQEDAYSALLHEFGHCLGLPHSRNYTHVMHHELGSTVISAEEAKGYRRFLGL
jgi:hypothetical protein